MFFVYHSNALDVLKDLLTHIVTNTPLDDPFATENILVQSPGMAQWLKLELAQAQGIAAAVDFPLPASYLWRNFAELLDDVPERSAFDKEAMTWRLMAVLPQCLDAPEFAALKGYLDTEATQAAGCIHYKSYQLCSRIADTFDQYLVYRPEWIEDWQAGGAMAAESQPWQPILWRALVAETARLGLSHWHRGNMMSSFIQKAEAKPVSKRLFVFGISALPQHYLDALAAIAKHSDVHLFVTNPCRSYWGDLVDAKFLAKIDERWLAKLDLPDANADLADVGDDTNPADLYEVGNPLLASMGKLGRDYLVQLQSMPVREIDAFAEAPSDGLLHQIQRDILDLKDPKDEAEKRLIATDDRSLRIHGCHSPMRELEVLHDQLLAMFDTAAHQGQTLEPKDIIVMMSDVATYAPYIDAVFGQAQGNHYIPYSIADKSLEQESPVLNSVMSFMQLGKSRLEVTDVLELLEVPAILTKLGLDEQSFKRIRHWVTDAHIRWGLSGEQRQQWDIPAFEQNSWLFGLKRMLAGYALGEQHAPWLEIAGYHGIEGLEAKDLGALVRFVELLCEACEAFSGDASLATWQQRVLALLDNVYEADPNDEFALEQIRKAMAQLQRVYGESGMDETIPVDVLIDFIQNHISGESSGRGFMVGAVNFCTLMPMRSIPFKVVCLLGMNDGSYPRSMPPLGFDLIAEHPQRGDRSRRDDDRYLFLEAILSAQEELYISYLSRSVQDNSEKVASVLVSELTEYIDAGYALHLESDAQEAPMLSEWLTTEHALVPYSKGYFGSSQVDDDSRLFSYAQDWHQALTAMSEQGDMSAEITNDQPAPLSPVLLDEQLDIDTLVRFFKGPVQQFFNQRLQVFFDDNLDGSVSLSASDTDATEPFDLDNLVKYQLSDRYLDAALEQFSSTPSIASQDGEANILNGLDDHIAAEGVLPVSAVAGRRQQVVKSESIELAQAVSKAMQGPRQRFELSVPLQVQNLVDPAQAPQSIELVGWQDHWYGERLIRYRAATAKGADYFAAWLHHLAACASELPLAETLGFAKGSTFVFRPLPPELAKVHLSHLVSLYQYGQSWPLALDINTAWKSLEAYNKVWEKQQAKANDEQGLEAAKNAALAAAIKAANGAVQSTPYHHGLDANPYLSKAMALSAFAPIVALPDEFLTNSDFAMENSLLPEITTQRLEVLSLPSSFGSVLVPWVNHTLIAPLPWLEISDEKDGYE
ncbi:MAG: exodeoxyribonuclease V subunit gamma [Pontibacterium sp.]